MSQYAMIHTKRGGKRLPKQLDPKGEGLMYGRTLAWVIEKLDEIAKAVDVTPLSSFYYDEDAELVADAGGPTRNQKQWHDPAGGIKTVLALQAFFEKPDKQLLDRSGLTMPVYEGIVWDLRAFHSILENLVKAREPFRIEIY